MAAKTSLGFRAFGFFGTGLAVYALLLLAGCGPSELGSDVDVAAAPPISGRYQVSGVTIDQQSGQQRPIKGVVTLSQEGSEYTTHFELSTVYPGSEATAAQVIGTGEGSIEGRLLLGQAETQLVVAMVPGMDVDFAFMPRSVGTRLVSSSRAEFFDDGTLRIEIENEPAEGQDYSPTTTILVGYRAPIR